MHTTKDRTPKSEHVLYPTVGTVTTSAYGITIDYRHASEELRRRNLLTR